MTNSTSFYKKCMPWKVMVRDLLLVISWIGCVDPYISIVNSSSYIINRTIRNVKFRWKTIILGSKAFLSSYFHRKWIMTLVSAFIWTKFYPRKLMHIPKKIHEIKNYFVLSFQNISWAYLEAYSESWKTSWTVLGC